MGNAHALSTDIVFMNLLMSCPAEWEAIWEMQLGNRLKESTHFVTTKWSTEAKQLTMTAFQYITKGK